METKTDISYGVVPVFQKADETWQVLIVHQISYRGDDFWILPKGHAEELETPQETARRELEEETGISSVCFAEIEPFSISYAFVHEGVRVEKTVEYYLGYCLDTATHITQPHEIMAVRWCSFEEAIDTLSHENSKRVLQQVERHLLSQPE